MYVTQLPALRDYWYAVARTQDPTPRSVRLFGQDYVLWQGESGEVVLTQPFCPHRGADLATASVTTDQLVCPYHGWQFGLDGRCTAIPQLDPGVPIPPKAKLSTWPVIERYGLLWTCIGEPAVPGPPAWFEADELQWEIHVDFFESWETSAFRIIDNNLDQSHPAFVHQGTFGDPTRPLVPKYELHRTTMGFRSRIPQYVGGVGPQMGIEDERQAFTRIQEAELLGPLHTRIRLEYGGDPPDYCFYSTATPIDDTHSIYIRCSALAGGAEQQPYDLFHSYSRRVVDEDRIVLESTHADFPIDITTEVHLRCDLTTLEYRRTLGRLERGEDKRGVAVGDTTSNLRPSYPSTKERDTSPSDSRSSARINQEDAIGRIRDTV
ncbi:MAG: Rieske 2Fe-2S domain-containing protein [Ferrimicrobium sp.]